MLRRVLLSACGALLLLNSSAPVARADLIVTIDPITFTGADVMSGLSTAMVSLTTDAADEIAYFGAKFQIVKLGGIGSPGGYVRFQTVGAVLPSDPATRLFDSLNPSSNLNADSEVVISGPEFDEGSKAVGTGKNLLVLQFEGVGLEGFESFEIRLIEPSSSSGSTETLFLNGLFEPIDYTLAVSAVPEPSTLVSLGLAGVILALAAARRRLGTRAA